MAVGVHFAKPARHASPWHIANQLPFEIWRQILHDVYASRTEISNPPSKFEWSPLNQRLHIYRCLALVNAVWRRNALDVFFEDLTAESLSNLEGITQAVKVKRELGHAVRTIKFSFFVFRCTASSPSFPRALRNPLNADGTDNEDPVAWADYRIYQNKAAVYEPSTTMQARHWNKWHYLISDLLHMCPNIRDTHISFTASRKEWGRYGRKYNDFFPVPNMQNEGVLHGLQGLSNLRSLDLVDPSPLLEYGPSLAIWERLRKLSITITRHFSTGDLPDTAFIPPRSLTSFTFHDHSDGTNAWPLSSDLARCTDLRHLDLGVTALSNGITTAAIAFLVRAYQATLTHLTLTSLTSGRQNHWEDETSGWETNFDAIFFAEPRLAFARLDTLHLVRGGCSVGLFDTFDAECLRYVAIGGFDTGNAPYNPDPALVSRERPWRRALSAPSVRRLRTLTLTAAIPEAAEARALRKVTAEKDIYLDVPVGETEGEPEEDNHDL